MGMSFSQTTLQKVFETEKIKGFPNLPVWLHYPFLPLLRLQMKWQVQHAIKIYKLDKQLEGYPLILEAVIQFACHLYRVSPMFHGTQRTFLQTIGQADMAKLICHYGDVFASAFVQSMMETTDNFDDATQVARRLHQRRDFYNSDKFQSCYDSIWKRFLSNNSQEKQYQFCAQVANIFDKLLPNRNLLEQYLAFFAEIATEEKVLKVLETISLICHNMGTTKSYETFLKFCKKFHVQTHFSEILPIAQIIINFRDPEIFHHTFFWAFSSPLSASIIEKIFLHAEKLLAPNPENPQYPLYIFQKFLEYVKKKESNLVKMNEEESNFYIKKAADFFLEQ